MARRIVVTAVGAVLVAMLVLGTVDTLVWLPQSLAPTTPLDRIYAVLSATHELAFLTSYVVVWLGFWSLLSALYVLLLLPAVPVFLPAAEWVGALGAAALGALLIGAVGFFHWWSAFGMAMSVSDELPPGVGGVTALGAVIEGGGVLVGLAGALVGVLALVLRRRGRAAVRTA